MNELGLIRRLVEQLPGILDTHDELCDVTVIEKDIPLAWGELGDKVEYYACLLTFLNVCGR
jgi:hypothetical protein